MNNAVNKFANILIFCGIVILSLTFFPIIVEEIKYNFRKPVATLYRTIDSAKQKEEFEKTYLSPEQKKIYIIPKSFEFSLVIPEIGVNSLVFPNVNSADPNDYLPILQKGVAHALGSSLPNEKGPVYIFAHSTDSFYNISHYNAVFFLLDKLKQGDEAFLFYKDRKYSYSVIDKKIVSEENIPKEVTDLKAKNVLILQTCWPPGTTLQRLLLILKALK